MTQTTTWTAIRDSQLTLMHRYRPLIPPARFIAHDGDSPFLAWALENAGSLRRYSVEPIGSITAPIVSSGLLHSEEWGISYQVSYPHRYNLYNRGTNRSDRHGLAEVMSTDGQWLRDRFTDMANFVPGQQAADVEISVLDLDVVSILEITCIIQFYRSRSNVS